jgi:hypothetical protein
MKKAYKLMLDEEVYERLRRDAYEQNVSVSELVRRSLDRGLPDKVTAEEFREAVLPYPPTATNAITIDPPGEELRAYIAEGFEDAKRAPEIQHDVSFGRSTAAPKPVRKK